MKFFTQNSPSRSKPQTFSRKVKKYKLDPLRNVLIADGYEDTHELVMSSKDCELKAVLNKFGFYPESMLTTGRIVPRDEDGVVLDKLVDTGKTYEKADDLREELGLPNSMSVPEIFAAISDMTKKAAAKLGINPVPQDRSVSDKGGEKDVKEETEGKEE